MNRNHLKIIAVISMIIDHVGAFLVDNNLIMRTIGRLAFPIFAFFIAEGLRYTRSWKKYVLYLLGFALISQIPYALLHIWWQLNILFTFLISILCIFLLKHFKENSTLYTVLLVLIGTFVLLSQPFGLIDYGFLGVLLVIAFYFIRDGKIRLAAGTSILCLMALREFALSGYVLSGLIQFAALLSVVLLAFYNGQKGRANLKWLFYITYPTHLLVIYIITLFV